MGRNNTQRYEPVITLNAKAAENILDGLKVKAKQVREALNEAGKMGDDRKVKELDRELKSIEATQRKIRNQTYDYNIVLRNLNTSSIKDLERTAKTLRNEIRQLTPGTQEFITKSKQLDLVRNRLDQLNGRVRETHSWLSRAGNSFNKYFGMATAAVASITGISFALRGAAQEAAKMDDIYSDVMKTTGLLREEVVWLNDEFKRISTRTSREQLNGLARDAGKLGIEGKENVLEFVRAANQINVALSEDLGEGAIRNIGKLAEVFKLTQLLGIEKSFLSIGSAINSLGQASTAQEQYLVDFTQRIAGVAYQSGMSIQNVLGFASALDQTGQKVEMSATAFQKFLMKMFSDTTTFANMANMEVAAFSELLRKDVNEAILKVLSSLNEKGGFASLVPIFQDMGLDGARAVSVMSALATNINLVKEAQSLSNKEFALATDLTREYNVKNENMQAQLEKARKKFKDQVIELGEKLSPAFLKSTNASTLFLKAIMNINKEFVYAALVLTGTIVAYKAWNLVLGIGNTIGSAVKLVNLGISWSLASVQGNAIRAAAAVKLFNATLSASAIGAIVTAVVALGYGLYKLVTYQSDLTKATKEYFKETEKLKREANDLLNIVEKSAVGSEEYKQAITKLTEQYGPYISHLIDEKGYLTDVKKAREEINSEIERSIALKLQDQLVSEIIEKGLKKQSDAYENLVKNIMYSGKVSESAARIQASSIVTMIKAGMDEYEVHQKRLEQGLPAIGLNWIRVIKKHNDQMIQELESAKNKFTSLYVSNEQMGPAVPSGFETEAQRKARAAKEKADAEAASEEERKRLKEEAEKRQKIVDEQFKKELEAIDRQEREKEVLLKKSMLESGMKKEEYEALMTDKTIKFLNLRNALYIKYNKDNTTIENLYYEALLNLADSSLKKMKESMAIMDKWMKKIKEAKEEIEPESKEDKAFWDNYNQLLKDAESVRNDYSERSWKARKEKEMGKLNEMLKLQMISQEEYEYGVKKLKLDSAEDIAKGVNSVVQSAAEFFSQLQERQYSKLEQEKARELALYGDSADARAEIEQKYEKKKLELQQRYADMDMVVKIAQTISAGALAGIQAFAQLGPIAGAVAAAFIGLTTSMSVATIVAQRNAIKNQTVASSDSAPSMSVNGYSEGGFTTRDLSDKKAVGVVHANEWVAPASMVRSNPLVFASLERQRVQKYSMHSPPKQFASGGYTTPTGSDNGEMALMMKTLITEIRSLKDKPFKGYVLLSDVNASQELQNRMKKEGSL